MVSVRLGRRFGACVAPVVTYNVTFAETPLPLAVVPLAFAFNLAGTLCSSGVILFVNSLTATPQLMHSVFGSKEKEHQARLSCALLSRACTHLLRRPPRASQIMRYPAFFLVGGVCSLFVGFIIGICLYYGLAVAGILALVVLSAVAFYEARPAL